jgi:phosphoglycolate phosphatase-like HAD superfamily hydrolase
VDASESFESVFRHAVRAEALALDGLSFADVMAAATTVGMSPDEVIRRALARIRQRDASRIGQLGERVARVRERKRRVPSASGTARFRVPDILTEHELIEIKNVSRLALTPQLADFLAHTESHGIRFVLMTRFDTELSPELRSLIGTGRIDHRALPGLLSENGRRLLRGLITRGLDEQQPRE